MEAAFNEKISKLSADNILASKQSFLISKEEYSAQEVRKMLACWKADNKSNQWADGLRFVQWQYNSRIHDAIGRSPYEAVFGRKPGMGIGQIGLPKEVADKIETEEQLEEVLQAEKENQEEQPDDLLQTEEEIQIVQNLADCAGTSTGQTLQQENIDPNGKCINCGVETEDKLLERCAFCGQPIHLTFLCSVEADDGTIICGLCAKAAEIEKQQKAAKEGLKQQAKKMTNDSEKRFGPVDIGTTVMVGIPDVDRGRAEFPNVKAVVIGVNEHNQYELGTEHGLLNTFFSRNQFTPCVERFLTAENVPTKKISLREAARSSAMTHGQGFFKCNCAKGCSSGRCKCFSNNVSCNSKCHPNIATCKNKICN